MLAIAEGVQVAIVGGVFAVITAALQLKVHRDNKRDHAANADLSRQANVQLSEMKGDVSGIKADVSGIKADVSGIKGDIRQHHNRLHHLESRSTPL